MKTRLLTPVQVADAAELLRKGGIVVFPTETVYGLGANALSETASAKIYQAKGRPTDNPLIVHVADVSGLSPLVTTIPEVARRMIEAFWPGPLTLVLPKNNTVPDSITAGLNSVAVRCPESRIARRLIELAGTPVAAPSANRSGRPSPTTFEMARAEMECRVDAIIDGGDCVHGLESTVVAVDDWGFRILRPGAITSSMLSEVAGISARAAGSQDDGSGPSVSPGTRHRHYQPDARLYVAERVDLAAVTEGFPHDLVGILQVKLTLAQPGGEGASDPFGEPIAGVKTFVDYAQYGRELYRSLYEFDRIGCTVIVAELPAAGGLGDALRDRLLRAAGGEFFPIPDELGT